MPQEGFDLGFLVKKMGKRAEILRLVRRGGLAQDDDRCRVVKKLGRGAFAEGPRHPG
jgi:hypothetical protein